MVNFQQLMTAFIAVFFSLPFAYANNPDPDADPYNDLFDYAYAKAPEETVEEKFPCVGQGAEPITVEACKSATYPDFSAGGGGNYTYTNPSVYSNGYASNGKYELVYVRTRCTLADTPFCSQQYGTFISSYPITETVYQCPPDAFPTYTYQSTIGQAQQCFNPQDLASRDSCNSSTEVEAFLPIGGNTSPTVCKTQPDGSICKYENTGDFYELAQESNCYQEPSDEWEDTPAPTPDENGCFQVSATTMCAADPEEVCTPDSNGIQVCPSGCGQITTSQGSVFACFDEPIVEPPNCETDPTLPECGEEPPEGTGTEVDTTGIETRIDTTNTKLDGLSTQVGTTNQILNETKAITDDLRNGVGQLNEGIGNLSQLQLQTRDELKNANGVDLKNMAPASGVESFYESAYPNGFDDVWAEVSPIWQQSAMNTYIDSWKITVAGSYTFPEMCINFSFADFGCHSFSIDERIWPFIRIVLILTTLMYARRLVTGG